jgi:hypothetical protein
MNNVNVYFDSKIFDILKIKIQLVYYEIKILLLLSYLK